MNTHLGTSFIDNIPSIKHISQRIAEDNYASKFATHLLEQINNFNNLLGDDFEVGLNLANFGHSIQFPVVAIGHIDPSLIIFYGVIDESPCELIQHVSQLNFALTSCKRKDSTLPKNPIGFR